MAEISQSSEWSPRARGRGGAWRARAAAAGGVYMCPPKGEGVAPPLAGAPYYRGTTQYYIYEDLETTAVPRGVVPSNPPLAGAPYVPVQYSARVWGGRQPGTDY